MPEVDVLGHGQARHDIELLVDRGDTQLLRDLWARQHDVLAQPLDRSRVGLVRTGEDLDERRLPRAVLPKQAMDLAGVDGEVDTIQGAGTRERLLDARQSQEWGTPDLCVGHPASRQLTRDEWSVRTRDGTRKDAGQQPASRPSLQGWPVLWLDR